MLLRSAAWVVREADNQRPAYEFVWCQRCDGDWGNKVQERIEGDSMKVNAGEAWVRERESELFEALVEISKLKTALLLAAAQLADRAHEELC